MSMKNAPRNGAVEARKGQSAVSGTISRFKLSAIALTALLGGCEKGARSPERSAAPAEVSARVKVTPERAPGLPIQLVEAPTAFPAVATENWSGSAFVPVRPPVAHVTSVCVKAVEVRPVQGGSIEVIALIASASDGREDVEVAAPFWPLGSPRRDVADFSPIQVNPAGTVCRFQSKPGADQFAILIRRHRGE